MIEKFPNRISYCSVQYFPILQCFMTLLVVCIILYVKIIRFRKQVKYFPNQKAFWSKWQTIPGEKLDYPVDLERFIKTGRLQVTPRELTGLVNFRSFLAGYNYKNGMNYYKKPVPLITYQLVSPVKRKKRATHKYCSSCCSTITT